MAKFAYEIGQRVKLVESNENGKIIGRAEYAPGVCENNYYVRYCAGDGRQQECWWGEHSVTAA